SLRCDANVSVRPEGTAALGTQVEIKNVNSFRFMQRALAYEIEPQNRVLTGGGPTLPATRPGDESEGRTFAMRGKEEAHDYRYFPEPDLPPLRLDPEWLARVAAELPELPGARMKRFMADYALGADDALLLTSTAATAAYFEEC